MTEPTGTEHDGRSAPDRKPPGQKPSGPKKHVVVKLLLVFGAMGLLGLTGFGVLGYFWYQNSGKALMQASEESVREGSAFGLGRSDQACIDEGLARAQGCGELSLECNVTAGGFVRGCLHQAEVSDALCEEVPELTSVWDSSRYMQRECEALGQNTPGCHQVFQGVQGYCVSTRRAAGTVASPEQ